MRTIVELLKEYKDLRTLEPDNTRYKKEVITQATRHCTRSDMTELYNIARPNEEDIYKEWRSNNLRHITVAPIMSFKLMLVRVLQSSFEEIDTEKFPELKGLAYDQLITISFYDPNALIIEWPFNPNNPNLSLTTSIEEGGIGQNQKIDSETHIINSLDIILLNNYLVVWLRGQMDVGDEKTPELVDYFAAVDDQYYYIIFPRKVKGDIEYDYFVWYEHGLGKLPIAHVPGFNTKDEYKETICWGAYEYLDEAVIALSSDQVTRIRHSQPKLVINADLTCPTCNGAATEILPNKEKIRCRTCNGAGSLQNIGDFATIKVRSKNGFDKETNNPVYYVNSPGDIKYSKEVWEDLISKAEKELCTDLLEGTGNESGIAKELRLEPRQDLLKMFGEQFSVMIEDVYNNHVQLIEPSAELIKISVPTYYQSKSPEMMAIELQASLPGERYLKYLDMVIAKYRNNDLMIKVHKDSALYAPLVLYKTDEIDTVINIGSYDELDIKRRDYAVYALNEVYSDEGNLGKPLEEIFELADQLLIKIGILPEPMKDSPFDDEATRSKLLDTVGGADAAIKINQAVADGVMTEAAAEKLLSKFFQISIEEARQLIEMPQNIIVNDDE